MPLSERSENHVAGRFFPQNLPLFLRVSPDRVRVHGMRRRCPGAFPLGMAKLPNYRLSERLYADIDFEEGAAVYGVLYCI